MTCLPPPAAAMISPVATNASLALPGTTSNGIPAAATGARSRLIAGLGGKRPWGSGANAPRTGKPWIPPPNLPRTGEEQKGVDRRQNEARAHSHSWRLAKRPCTAVNSTIVMNSGTATVDAMPRFHQVKPWSYMK